MLLAAPHWPVLVDDLFITTAYAWEWVDTGVLRWTTGEVVEGYSNTLWLLVVTGAAAVGADTLLVAKLASLGAAAALLIGLSRLAPPDPRGDVLVLAVVCWAPFARWSAVGMETMLFAALLAFGWALALDGRRGTRAGAAVLLGLAALTHLEGHGHLVLALVAAGVRRPRLRREDVVVVAVIVALLAWHVARVVHFGHLVPTPGLAKLGAVSMTWRGVGQLGVDALAAAGIAVAAALALRPRGRDLPWILAPVALQAVLLLRADGDWMAWSRFLLPGVCATLLAAAATSTGPRGPRWSAIPAAVVGIGCGLAVPGYGLAVQWRDLGALVHPIASYTGGFGTVLAEDLEYIVETVPDGATVLTGDVGIVGQVPGVHVRDTVGLVYRRNAERRVDRTPADPAALALEYGDEPGQIGFLRVAFPVDEPAPELEPWLAARFTSSREIRSQLFRATWYRAQERRPARAVVRARWESLAGRYPRIGWLAWHADLARADAGDIADPPPRLSFPRGPLPLEWIEGRGFALYAEGLLLSRPISSSELASRLVVDVDNPGSDGARVGIVYGGCRTEANVYARVEFRLDAICPQATGGDRVEVRFRNDAVSTDGDRNLYASIEAGAR